MKQGSSPENITQTPTEKTVEATPEKIHKPTNLVVSDFRKQLLDVVNNSPLPASITALILAEVNTQTQALSRQVTMSEQREYDESVQVQQQLLKANKKEE